MHEPNEFPEETPDRNASPSPASGSSPTGSEDGRRTVAISLLLYKVVFFFFVLCSIELLPIFEESAFERIKSWPPEGEPTLASRFGTWDSAHYLHLAENGYAKDDASSAFYPLLPFLIHLGSYLTIGNPVIAGLLIANVASFAALWTLYRLVATYQDEETARLSLIFLLAFPGAFFLNLIYTEGLFLLWAVLFFHFLFHEEYLKAALMGFLLPLTKAVGVFVLVPLVWHLWVHKQPLRCYAAVLGPLTGYGAYFVTLWAFTGNPFEGFEAQKYYPNQPSIANIFNIPGFLDALWGPLELHDYRHSLIDRLVFFLFLGALPVVFRINKTYFFYAFFAGLIPALAVWFPAYTRSVVVAFPMFISLATLFRAQPVILSVYVLALFAAIQTLFILRHINFLWAG